MNLFKKRACSLLFLSLIIACNDDDSSIPTSNLDFTITTEASAGNVVGVKPSSSGAEAEYSVDFGDPTATNNTDVIATSGPKVTYTYPTETATYTITVTASAEGTESVQKLREHTVTYNIPQTDVVGRWVLYHNVEALYISSQPVNGDYWWTNTLHNVITRACLFDDIYEFKSNGSFINILGDETWLEPFQGVNEEQCGTPIAPHDGKTSATWFHDENAATIQISGKGAYLGLVKVYTNGELSSPEAAPNTITYNSVTFSEDKNTMTMQIQNGNTDNGNNGTWKFKFAREGSEGASILQTDTDSDGVIDVVDACPNVYGTEANGCPLTAAPTDAPTAPTHNATNVISLFSNTYTNVSETNWSPYWAQSTVSTIETIAGNEVIKYANLNYIGIELSSSQHQNLSNFSHIHFDYWTADASYLNLYLISPGPIENSVSVSEVVKNSWKSIDIPLSSYTAPDLSDIFQLKFEGRGTVYIDNLYFYK